MNDKQKPAFRNKSVGIQNHVDLVLQTEKQNERFISATTKYYTMFKSIQPMPTQSLPIVAQVTSYPPWDASGSSSCQSRLGPFRGKHDRHAATRPNEGISERLADTRHAERRTMPTGRALATPVVSALTYTGDSANRPSSKAESQQLTTQLDTIPSTSF